jgi:isoleucyl-tRNA synthetase
MDLVRELISLGRNIREEVRIKVRQPLSEALIDGKNEATIADLVPLIEEELNVKKVTFISDLDNYMSFIVKPNFKEVGKVFGPKIKAFGDALLELSYAEVVTLQNGGEVSVKVDNEDYVVNEAMVDIRTSSKAGFDVATLNNNFIILSTELTEELLLEGIARELISKVQNLRKALDFDIIDRINIYYEGNDTIDKAVDKFKEFIMNETLSLDVKKGSLAEEIVDLNGHDVKIKVEKAK